MRFTCHVLISFGNVGCCVDFECVGDNNWNEDGSEINEGDSGQSEKGIIA